MSRLTMDVARLLAPAVLVLLSPMLAGWLSPVRATLSPLITLAAQESTPALNAAARRYREVRAICADFEQVIDVRQLRRTVENAGRICQQRPNLFSMRFTDPDGDMVVSDGEYVWVYYPSQDENQVFRHPVADSPGRQDFFSELLEDPGGEYAAAEGGIEVVDGRDCRVVTLTPRAGASYRRARLWLDTETNVIRKVEIHEQSDNVRTVTLRNVDLSSMPDPALFVFEVPEGARVLGRRRGSGDRPDAR